MSTLNNIQELGDAMRRRGFTPTDEEIEGDFF